MKISNDADLIYKQEMCIRDRDKQAYKHRQRNIQAEGVDAVADGGRDDLHIAGKANDSQDPACLLYTSRCV